MATAITNHLIVNFDYKKIDEQFDFYIVSTCEKYINKGAYELDTPTNDWKAESIVFDNGRSLYIMFKKEIVGPGDFKKILNNDKLSVEKKKSEELKDYILFRLFLFSINNFEGNLKFNNITGKLFITKASWKVSKKVFNALSINVDYDMNINAQATSFSLLTAMNRSKYKDEPLYAFSNINCALKRVFNENDYDDIYIRKPLYDQKIELTFLDLSKSKIKDNKSYYIYHSIDLLVERYKDLLEVDFAKVDILKSIGKFKDKDFMNKAFESIKRKKLYFSLQAEKAYEEDFYDLANHFNLKEVAEVMLSNGIKEDGNNIVYLHRKKYYETNKYSDPYKSFSRNNVIQCITIEDSGPSKISENEAIFNTIVKEIVIKDDIINNKRISLDDWKSYGFKSDWIFGKEKDNKYYVMVVKPDGSFELNVKENAFYRFNDVRLNKCVDCLMKKSGNDKTYILYGDNVNVISRTTNFMLPSRNLFELETISRSKEYREKYLSGIVDINCYNIGGDIYFNSGIKGCGMNTSIPKASLLYKCDVVEGKNIVFDMLETMSVSFVKYNSFTVLPYPIKYLNEYIVMMESENNK